MALLKCILVSIAKGLHATHVQLKSVGLCITGRDTIAVRCCEQSRNLLNLDLDQHVLAQRHVDLHDNTGAKDITKFLRRYQFTILVSSADISSLNKCSLFRDRQHVTVQVLGIEIGPTRQGSRDCRNKTCLREHELEG